MYEIIIVAAILTTLFISVLYARTRGREDSIEEVPDGGEDIAAPSQQEHKLETVETARLTAYVQPPPTASSSETVSPVEPTIEIQIESPQETAPVAVLEQPPVVQPVEQPAVPEVIAPPVFEPEIQQAQPPAETSPPTIDVAVPAISPATEFDDPRTKVIEILSIGSAPKTVREIAQAYYGKGSYNKRKDSRIRRILAEMTKEGLLIETSLSNSRAFEIKKAA